MKKRINSILNKVSITKKIIIIFIGSTLLPVSFIMIYNYVQTANEMQSRLLNSLESSLSTSASELNNLLDSAVQLSILYNREDIINFLNKEYTSEYEYIVAHQNTFYNYFGFDLLFYEQVDNITYYTNNETILSGKIVTNDKSLFYAGEINVSQGSIALNANNNINLMYRKSDIITGLDTKYQYTIVHDIIIENNIRKYDAEVNIELNSNYILEVINSTTALFSSVVLLDENYSVVASSNFNEHEFLSSFEDYRLDENVVIEKVGSYPIYICGIYDNKIMSVETWSNILELMLYFFIAILFSLVFIFLVGNNITYRTKEIVKHANEIAKGNFNYKSVFDSNGIDEIGTIEKSLMHLNSQIKTLIDNEKELTLTQVELEKQNSEAKMQALQSQVNPHFLFNALESIRLKAVAKKEIETSTMIKYMAKMFRNIIEWDEEMIQISEEVSFLEEYLAIQKYRFGNELNYNICVQEEAQNYLIPKMLIQPIVENACAHGIESVSRDTFIDVSIIALDDNVIITVKDNGGGIEEEKLVQIKSMLRDNTKMKHSIGISNVHQRLKLFFNGKCSMEIDSEVSKGTACKMILPIIKRGNEDV